MIRKAPPLSQRLKSDGGNILFGRRLPSHRIGFDNSVSNIVPETRSVTLPHEGHLLTSAPTGAGKLVSSMGLVLAQHPGSAIVFDITGAAANVWARRRRDMGQQVKIIDPFHNCVERSDGIDLFEYFDLPGACPDSDCESFAAILATGHESTTDRYWGDAGCGVTSGLLRFILSLPQARRNLSTLRKLIHDPDLDSQMHAILASGSLGPGLAEDEFAAYLTAPSDKTRPCILSTAQTFVKSLGGAECLETLQNGTISLRELWESRPQTIFIVAPQNRLKSHRNYWRLLFEVLLSTVFRRQRLPRWPTFFMIDEAATLGELPTLKQAICMGRAAGLRVHTVWQDLSQIQAIYPKDWQTVLNNSRTIQTFGFHNYLLAQTWAEIFGCSPQRLEQMPASHQALYMAEQGLVQCRRLNYLHDPEFVGLFDPDPRYGSAKNLPSKPLSKISTLTTTSDQEAKDQNHEH